MKDFNWIVVVTAGLFVLGVVADFAGAFGVDVNQSITIRWLLAEVVISAAIILVMAQFMIQMKLKLGGAGSKCSVADKTITTRK
jgi:hypothetical protein